MDFEIPEELRMLQDTVRRFVRTEASMVKIFATEMATPVADRAMQAHGGMGMSKDLPLEFIYRRLRPMRIFEGPTEIHRWVIARRLLKD